MNLERDAGTGSCRKLSCLYPENNGKSKKVLNKVKTQGYGMEKAVSEVAKVKVRGKEMSWILQ